MGRRLPGAVISRIERLAKEEGSTFSQFMRSAAIKEVNERKKVRRMIPASLPLMKYDAARRALAEACRVDDVKTIRNKAHAVVSYARQAKDTDMISWAMEIKVRAERRAGELLKEMPLHQPGPGRGKTGKKKGSSSNDSFSSLKDLGISKDQSSQWQKVAAIPTEKFEQQLAQVQAKGETLTTKQLLRHGAARRVPIRTRAEKTANPAPSRWPPEDQFIFDLQAIVQRLWHQLNATQRAEVLGEVRQILDQLEENLDG